MKLQAFLTDLATREFRWGETDCALALADWWQANHGVDPAIGFRGSYATEAECAELLKRSGHLPRLMSRVARSIGARRTSNPKPGDLACVRVGGAWWGAIMTPSYRWTIKANDARNGLRDCKVVAAWSID